jgi:hypothetical protein
MPSTDDLNGDRLTPVHERRSHLDLDVGWVEPGGAELDVNPLSDNDVILASFTGDAGADRGRRLLADPEMDQATQLDDPEKDRQQHEGNRQHRLQRFLAPLLPSLHDVWARR